MSAALPPCFHGRTGAEARACCGSETAAPYLRSESALLPRRRCPACGAPGGVVLCGRCVDAGHEAPRLLAAG